MCYWRSSITRRRIQIKRKPTNRRSTKKKTEFNRTKGIYQKREGNEGDRKQQMVPNDLGTER